MGDPIEELTKLSKSIEMLANQEKAISQKLNKQILEFNKLPEFRVKLNGLIKTYMDAVRRTDGLTSVRPATLKAIQTAEKDPMKDGLIARAVIELRKHVNDQKDQKDKKAKQFKDAVNSIISQIEDLA